MTNNRFGRGVFNGPERQEPQGGGSQRGEGNPWGAGNWDDSEDEGVGQPWIGVHVLTQFVFCPRAGLLALEQGRPDDGTDPDRPPRLDYLPDYRPVLIGEELDRVRHDLWKFTTYASPALVVMVLVAFFQPLLALLLFLASLIFIPWIYRHVRDYLILRGRQRLALRATGRAPDPSIAAPQIVNWWELLKADFEPMKPSEPHRDRSLRILGTPYLILTHKGQRIPVIRKWTGKEQLHRKDYARCAAYAHLIETCEHTTSPFAIILFGKGYNGLAVPIGISEKKAFQYGLDRAYQELERVAAGNTVPDKPESNRLCSGCHFGRPRLHRPGKSETILGEARLAARCTEARSGKTYHCTCRDRFGKRVPPHKLAVVLGLTD